MFPSPGIQIHSGQVFPGQARLQDITSSDTPELWFALAPLSSGLAHQHSGAAAATHVTASLSHCFINYFNDNLLLRLLIKLLREEENHIASKSELLLHGAIRKVLLKYLHSSTPVVKQWRFPVSVTLCLEPGDRPSCPRLIWRLAAMVKKRISPFRVLPFISDCGRERHCQPKNVSRATSCHQPRKFRD